MAVRDSGTEREIPEGYLRARWLFLRGLGLIFFSAFYSLAFQVHGLIGEKGILPAGLYLDTLSNNLGAVMRVWAAPTLLWLGSGDAALTVLVAAGLVASILLVVNVAPKISVALCTLFFLSCIAVLQDFSSYQSDGMLLEAGFLSIFFAPSGARPGLAPHKPPSTFSLFMLRWEWFRIYFESGLVKLLSGDPHWRNLTAMDDYYQNGPLPAWPGWYVQQLPHWYHAGTVIITLGVELVIVWALFLPRPFRIGCFLIVTALQIGIISTANYAFLNYLVLVLGVLLLDDRVLARLGFRVERSVSLVYTVRRRVYDRVEAAILGLLLYTTIVAFLLGGSGSVLALPDRLLQPFRIANAYGLFAVMTPARYEIEFQGSNDGKTWTPYPFQYKPQNVLERPGVYAPYQPRFDWNLWFASLEPWRASPWVVLVQERLLEGSPSVLSLFRGDPFHGKPPTMVRTILWQYWFTDIPTKRRTGAWWRRQELEPFTPLATRQADGNVVLSGGSY
ncbi:MAG TPA: lipase maturation factor family protein [Gemmatimonadaceae bacterium]|nr:lipase maturation factor family protein [Gemmatimonadaceae bacterium]